MKDRFGECLLLHAIAAELRCLGYRICVEMICWACYDFSNRSGLLSKCWKLLPRAWRCKPPSRSSQGRCSVLGDWCRICERPSEADSWVEPGH